MDTGFGSENEGLRSKYFLLELWGNYNNEQIINPLHQKDSKRTKGTDPQNTKLCLASPTGIIETGVC